MITRDTSDKWTNCYFVDNVTDLALCLVGHGFYYSLMSTSDIQNVYLPAIELRQVLFARALSHFPLLLSLHLM